MTYQEWGRVCEEWFTDLDTRVKLRVAYLRDGYPTALYVARCILAARRGLESGRETVT